MGFSNSRLPWKEFEAVLSDTQQVQHAPDPSNGDGPVWSQRRVPYEPPMATAAPPETPPYIELHCHSNFSFLDGASHPEELVETAAQLGYKGISLTDHNGMYGIVRFAEAAQAFGLSTIFGAEISLGDTGTRFGPPDPDGRHLVVLARSAEGYRRLSTALGKANIRGGEKHHTIHVLSELADLADQQHFAVLTGCRKGLVPHTLRTEGMRAANQECDMLINAFGAENVFVELWDHRNPEDDERNTLLVGLSQKRKLQCVVTNNVHFASPKRMRLANIVAAIRARRNLDEIDAWLPSIAGAYLQAPSTIYERFKRYAHAVENSVALGLSCAFDLSLITPNLPHCEVPEGHTEMTWLRELVERGAHDRYGNRSHERVFGAYKQIEHELDLIEKLGFPGYFLIVHDIVQFCHTNDIYYQGRGSAANSAVCYALGITNADAVALGLLFERFLSPERDGPPDIDIDIESGRREEVIQYVYNHYGRDYAAQVCNVITYRSRSAMRDVARAFGYAQGQQDAWSKKLDRWSKMTEQEVDGVPKHVIEHATALQDFPRHLGVHSGGMVLCDRPVVDVCPTEWARKENRSVLQWDKDDCARVGLVKFDLLGLGMLSMLHYASDFIREHFDATFDIAFIPQDDAVYDMLCNADSLGVFQIESRAQIATLPRLRPRTFYDLVVEVALIRPGPIQGGSVHPYIRRRNGQEPVTYLHPLLEPSLKKTLGVPLFQEQLMQIAIDVAGFSAAESDQLRVAMGSKRSKRRMEQLRQRLYDGMSARGISPNIAEVIFQKLVAFANYGFPESHSVSFAFLVYASAWMKCFYPQCFLAGLLNAQPMGFWSPRSLVADAERHGVVVKGPDVNFSKATAHIEPDKSVRLGLSSVQGISTALGEEIASHAPYKDMESLAWHQSISKDQFENLALAGACGSLGISRRQALWVAGAMSQVDQGRLPGILTGTRVPNLPEMSEFEEVLAELTTFGISPGRSIMQFYRQMLQDMDVLRSIDLLETPSKSKVRIAGIVTHRQRPATAQGITFVNIEDEVGMTNVICSRGFWKRYRKIISSEPAVLIAGLLERSGIVVNVIAERVTPLPMRAPQLSHLRSRDFR